MQWDGSHLGEFTAVVIQREHHAHSTKYWRLQLGEQSIFASVRPLKSTLPCIIDELKRVFALTRTGTHRITIDGTGYLLFRESCLTIGDQEIIVTNPCLSEAHGPEVENARRLIQYVFAFRELMGLSPNHNGVIKLRTTQHISRLTGRVSNNPLVEVLSVQDNTLRTTLDHRVSLPQTILTQWFSDVDVTDTVCMMTGFTGQAEDIQAKLSHYRAAIKAVIDRIDRSQVWLCNAVCERLLRHYLRVTAHPEDRPWAPEEFEAAGVAP